MTKDTLKNHGGKALAGAIGSAAVAAAMLYVSKRKEKRHAVGTPPSGELPQTD